MTSSDELELAALKKRAETNGGLEFDTSQDPLERKTFKMWAIPFYYKGEISPTRMAGEFMFSTEKIAQEALDWLKVLKGE